MAHSFVLGRPGWRHAGTRTTLSIVARTPNGGSGTQGTSAVLGGEGHSAHHAPPSLENLVREVTADSGIPAQPEQRPERWRYGGTEMPLKGAVITCGACPFRLGYGPPDSESAIGSSALPSASPRASSSTGADAAATRAPAAVSIGFTYFSFAGPADAAAWEARAVAAVGIALARRPRFPARSRRTGAVHALSRAARRVGGARPVGGYAVAGAFAALADARSVAAIDISRARDSHCLTPLGPTRADLEAAR